MRFFLSIVGIALTSQTVLALDWPQWRGPDRTDLSKESGLLTSWPDGGPKKVWMFKKAGIGYSGPAVVDGVLYTMGYRDGAEQLIALDALTGTEKWALQIGKQYENRWGDGPRGTPTYHAGKIYALGANGDFYCVDAKTGKETWKKDLKEFGGKIPKWGYCESPLIEGELVIVTPGGSTGTVIAFAQKGGEKVWQSPSFTGSAEYSSCMAITHKGQRQIVKLVMDKLVGLDAKTGAKLWSSTWPGRTAVIPTPIIHDGKVFIASGYGIGCKLVDIGDNEAKDVWVNKNMKNHHGGVILKDGHLYGYSDGVGWTCMKISDGSIVWNDKKVLGKGAIAYADGHFYCLDERSGEVALIEASPKGWNEKDRFKISPQTKLRKPAGRIWTHPVICNGKLYLRDQELIYCYDVKGSAR